MRLAVLDSKLNRIGDSFNYINSGGCACVAAMIAQQLRTVFPIMRITSSNYGYGGASRKTPGNLDVIRNKLHDDLSMDAWECNGLTFGHVWVEIFVNRRWYALDSTGVRPIKDMYARWGVPAKGSFTHQEVQALAANTSWNSTFDRRQLPGMKKLIKSELGEQS